MQRVVSPFRVFVHGSWIGRGVLQPRIHAGRSADPRGFLSVGVFVGAIGNAEAAAEPEGREGSEEWRENGKGREAWNGNRE